MEQEEYICRYHDGDRVRILPSCKNFRKYRGRVGIVTDVSPPTISPSTGKICEGHKETLSILLSNDHIAWIDADDVIKCGNVFDEGDQ